MRKRGLSLLVIILRKRGTVPLFRKWIAVSADFLNNSGYMSYSRVEVAVDTRHSARCCGPPPRLRCNEVDAVRSARPKGERCRHKIICYTSNVF